MTGFAALALLVIRTATEEGKLVERFGDDYRRYMARTGRFFPRFRSAPAAEPQGESSLFRGLSTAVLQAAKRQRHGPPES